MALQKNIKEVESTEAGFIANAAAKNDGFLTDVIGYPMIKRRGNDYDYWFPEKSRDELGTYTYYDKTVKDLTALNDCIVQRRLSSYGDADTYLDLSTDDQVVLNVGGVPFLTVVESGGAAIGTLGGNLALGANTISRDGAAGKGFGFSESGIPTVYGDLVVDGNLKVAELTASQIVETDANKKLISVAKGTAYNANFGTGSNDVCRGNDPRLSDARVPTAHLHAIADITNLQTTLNAKQPIHANLTSISNLSTTPSGRFLVTNGSEIVARSLQNSDLPAIAITDTFVVNSQSAMLALSTAERGDVAVRTDLNKSFILKGDDYSKLEDWQELLTPTDTVLSVDGRTGVVSLSDKYQPLDSDLTAIAGLTHSNRHVLISNGTNWTRRALTEDDLPSLSATKITSGTLDNARLSFNPDYFVQGINSRRSVILKSASPLDSNKHSTFFTMYSSDPTYDSRLSGHGIGFRSQHGENDGYALDMIGNTYGDGTLLFGGVYDNVRQPWRAIWHEGNFNPADYQSAITGTGNKVLSIQADGTGVKTGSIYDDGNVVLIGKTTATGGYKFEVEGNTLVNGDKLVVYNAGETDTFIEVSNRATELEMGDGLIVGVDAGGDAVLKVDYGRHLRFQSDDSGSIEMATLRYTGTTWFNVNGEIGCNNGYIKNKLMVGSLDETPENQLVVYNVGETDTFIEVANGVTGLGSGLKVGVEAAFGDAVLKVDYGRFLRFQCETSSGIEEMAVLRYTGTTLFNVDGYIQCDGFRLDQNPISGTITPDKYITINCNGTDYKIPVEQV